MTCHERTNTTHSAFAFPRIPIGSYTMGVSSRPRFMTEMRAYQPILNYCKYHLVLSCMGLFIFFYCSVSRAFQSSPVGEHPFINILSKFIFN